MAGRCDICAKGSQTGHRVSHAKNRTKRRFKPNLKTLRTKVNGKKKKLTVCTKCLKMVKSGRINLDNRP